MERFLQVFTVLVLAVIGVSCLLSIRAHYLVWRYAPEKERLPRPRPE